MDAEKWSANLKKHYPNVNIEKVKHGKKGRGFVVFVDGKRLSLNCFLRRYSRYRFNNL